MTALTVVRRDAVQLIRRLGAVGQRQGSRPVFWRIIKADARAGAQRHHGHGQIEQAAVALDFGGPPGDELPNWFEDRPPQFAELCSHYRADSPSESTVVRLAP